MTSQLYQTPLPESQATNPPEQGVQSNVDLQGLLEQGGVATENIATSNIDVQVTGQFRLGPIFSEKLEKEVNSLSKSSYTALPYYDSDATEPDRGYYELQSGDVNPAHKTAREATEYTLNLTETGTKQTHWRAVTTNDETINTGLATGSSGLIGVPVDARKTRWFDPTGANGTEVASATSTVDAEFGQVDVFDPANPTFSDPTLLYELPYASEGDVDVRVWDDRGVSKYALYESGDATVGSATVGTATVGTSTEVNQWTHAYHTSFEFEGSPVVDNGLLRVAFDEGADILRAQEWDGEKWAGVSISHDTHTLFDADITHIGPSDVEVFAEFTDVSDGSIDAAVMTFQRGIDGVVVRDPQNGDVPTDLENMISPIASDQTTDRNPKQTVKSRNEVK
jgi:hypothetical protein